MAELEETASVLNFLPKNYALRVLLMAVAITLCFVLAYLPWFFKDKKKVVWKLENEEVKESL